MLSTIEMQAIDYSVNIIAKGVLAPGGRELW